jgi:hypothetical protein
MVVVGNWRSPEEIWMGMDGWAFGFWVNKLLTSGGRGQGMIFAHILQMCSKCANGRATKEGCSEWSREGRGGGRTDLHLIRNGDLKRRKKRWGFMGKWAKMLLTPMGNGRRRGVDAEQTEKMNGRMKNDGRPKSNRGREWSVKRWGNWELKIWDLGINVDGGWRKERLKGGERGKNGCATDFWMYGIFLAVGWAKSCNGEMVP